MSPFILLMNGVLLLLLFTLSAFFSGSETLLFSLLAPFSNLSSPVSASEVKCPTSVMFIMCFTLKPL